MQRRGCCFLFLPACCPDLNPIELAFSNSRHTSDGSGLGPSTPYSRRSLTSVDSSNPKNVGTS
ncbi:hypothetical protein [Sulfitobacter sp. OXR-159]|uniref:hypothetical protein n=1 Tax=Sulfitobacter sp. OXR-159 TaxID=3100174 RepID=UPI0039FCB8D7